MRKGIAFIVFAMLIVMFSAQAEAFLWFKDKSASDVVPEQLTAQVAELQQTVETLKGELVAAQQELAEANGMISALNEKLAASGAVVCDPAAKLVGAGMGEGEPCCDAMGTNDCCSQVAQDSAAAQQ